MSERNPDSATPLVRSAKPNPAPLPRARPTPIPREADAGATPAAPSAPPNEENPAAILE